MLNDATPRLCAAARIAHSRRAPADTVGRGRSRCAGRLDGIAVLLPGRALFLYTGARKDVRYETGASASQPIDDIRAVPNRVDAMMFGSDRIGCSPATPVLRSSPKGPRRARRHETLGPSNAHSIEMLPHCGGPFRPPAPSRRAV